MPTILGCGCNVPGALATRILETEKQRFIAMTLMAISIPCMAQSAMIFAILGRYGMKWILIVYFTLLVLYIFLGLLLKRIVRGESPELLLEVPPYRKPDPRTLLKKTWSKAYGFLAEAVPFVILGIFIVNLLSVSGNNRRSLPNILSHSHDIARFTRGGDCRVDPWNPQEGYSDWHVIAFGYESATIDDFEHNIDHVFPVHCDLCCFVPRVR